VHHENSHFLLPNPLKPKKFGIWKDVVDVRNEENFARVVFIKGLNMKLGNGKSIRFWTDKLIDEKPLKDLFPELFSISVQHRASIFEISWFKGTIRRWRLGWAGCYRRKNYICYNNFLI